MEATTKISNRLTKLFETKSRHLLNVYFTAGFPQLHDTLPILQHLQHAGVDMVEIGIPFSDPLADGPTIQRSSEQALSNGMSMRILFDQLKDMRKTITLPVLLMGYLNPVLQYGVEKFCKKASEAGVDGIILPDLPFDEFNDRYREVFESYNLSNVFLITPHTSLARLKEIDNTTQGFLYVVSTDSTTGSNKTIFQAAEYFQRIRSADLKNPSMIGFNINDRQSFEFAGNYAAGAIIGSAFIKAIANGNDLSGSVHQFVKSIKD